MKQYQISEQQLSDLREIREELIELHKDELIFSLDNTKRLIKELSLKVMGLLIEQVKKQPISENGEIPKA